MASLAVRRGLIVTVTGALAASGCASHAPKSGDPPSATASAPTARKAADPHDSVADGSHVGRNGAAAWRVVADSIDVSTDTGRTYVAVPLPANVQQANVEAAYASVLGDVYLVAAGAGSAIQFLRTTVSSGAWSPVGLNLSWPKQLSGVGDMQPTSVAIAADAKDDRVLVAAQLNLSHVVSVVRTFYSTDAGASFERHDLPLQSDLDTPWSAEAVAAAALVAVVGVNATKLFYSKDDGASWSRATIDGLPAGQPYALDRPVVVDSAIYVPAVIMGSENDEFMLLRSDDDGATFSAPATGDQLPSPPGGGAVAVAYAANTWWLVSPRGGVVDTSVDGGKSWNRITSPSLAPDVVDIGAASAADASVTIQASACAQGKADCSSKTTFETTSDGGRTWRAI